jgi:hypothetical protein
LAKGAGSGAGLAGVFVSATAVVGGFGLKMRPTSDCFD